MDGANDHQGVQTRTLRSDNLGRLVSETHPENGTATYAWDDAGNLVLKTDARGVTTGTIYDVLGRVVREALRFRATLAHSAGIQGDSVAGGSRAGSAVSSVIS